MRNTFESAITVFGREDWKGRHNATVRQWMNLDGVRPGERAILDLGKGIYSWIRRSGNAADGLFGLEVTMPLLRAFSVALNGECGRLDCGTLSTWAYEAALSVGLDLGTETWVRE